jgi:hypothetical protein
VRAVVSRNYRTKAEYEELAGTENPGQAVPPQEDDEIFAFGFSRGAFTIRVLVGLIADRGLVSYRSESELDRQANAAYRAYRAENFKSLFRVEWVFRKLRDIIFPARHTKNERPVKEIRFLGLWDTVAAYGLPIDEMTRGVSRFLFPLELPTGDMRGRSYRRGCALQSRNFGF